MLRYLGPVILGLAGVAVLVSLGLWQLQRMAWKEGVLAEIAARIGEAPAALPRTPDPARDRYLPVAVAGRLTGQEALVLASRKGVGPVWRVIAVLETDEGRRILVDRGYVTEDTKAAPRQAVGLAVTGNLAWPDEADGYTPAPDPARGLWFARDLPAMATHFGTEPVLVVAREPTGDGIIPWPVDASGIPNDHLGYAIQWFAMAVVWAGMTLLLLWRIRRRTA